MSKRRSPRSGRYSAKVELEVQIAFPHYVVNVSEGSGQGERFDQLVEVRATTTEQLAQRLEELARVVRGTRDHVFADSVVIVGRRACHGALANRTVGKLRVR